MNQYRRSLLDSYVNPMPNSETAHFKYSDNIWNKANPKARDNFMETKTCSTIVSLELLYLN